MQVWLHKCWDEEGEAGFTAWDLSHLGFATWAETEAKVLERAPGKLVEHCDLLGRHGITPVQAPTGDEVEVVERVEGASA